MKNRIWVGLLGIAIVASAGLFAGAQNGTNPGLSDNPNAVDTTQPSTSGSDVRTPDTGYGPSSTMGVRTNVSGLTDRDVAQRVRTSIRGDSTLPPSAQHVKVRVSQGRVRLRGKVPSQSDKDMIGSKAAEIVGSGNVDNELNVK